MSDPSADRLVLAALTGLLGLAACAGSDPTDPKTDDHDHSDPTDTDTTDTDTTDTDTTDPTTPTSPTTPTPTTETTGVISVVVDEDILFDEFQAQCLARGGVLQTHAVCAGNNACAGVSFNKFSKELTEHTCRAMNTCGGISCVELPADQGRTGPEIYEDYCGPMCHSAEFVLPVHPAADPTEALATFQGRSREHLVAVLAFGVGGTNGSGTGYANMPPMHDLYARAELERVVDHVRTMTPTAEPYGIVGETEDMN